MFFSTLSIKKDRSFFSGVAIETSVAAAVIETDILAQHAAAEATLAAVPPQRDDFRIVGKEGA